MIKPPHLGGQSMVLLRPHAVGFADAPESSPATRAFPDLIRSRHPWSDRKEPEHHFGLWPFHNQIRIHGHHHIVDCWFRCALGDIAWSPSVSAVLDVSANRFVSEPLHDSANLHNERSPRVIDADIRADRPGRSFPLAGLFIEDRFALIGQRETSLAVNRAREPFLLGLTDASLSWALSRHDLRHAWRFAPLAGCTCIIANAGNRCD